MSRYLKKKENLQRITNIKEICLCLNEYQSFSNNVRIGKNLNAVHSLAVIKPINKKIMKSFLQITQLESLYNIQTIKKKDQFLIYTSVFSDIDNKVSLNAIASDEEIHQNSSKINPIIDSEISLQVLIDKQANLKKDLELLQRIEDLRKDSNENEEELDVNFSQNTFIPYESDIPHFCLKNKEKRHNGSCNKHCFYTINELKTLATVRLEDELSNHDHPRKLLKKKNKYFSANERRMELIEHYKIYHKKQ